MGNTRSATGPDVTGLQVIQSYSTFVADDPSATYSEKGIKARKKSKNLLH